MPRPVSTGSQSSQKRTSGDMSISTSINAGGSNLNIANSSTAISASTVVKSNDASWTPPLWLTREKHPPRARSMTIPIPPVPPATRKAIAKVIASQRPPHYKQQAQINTLQIRLKEKQEKVEKAQLKLDRLEENKEEKLAEIKVIREEEIEESLKKIKEEMEKEHEEAAKLREEEWKQNTEREMKAAKRQFKKEQAEAEEKELESHKQKMEEEKKAQQELVSKTSIEDGEVGADVEDDKLLPSQKLEREHKKVKEKLDGLKETKKEMVWLLKQVINAENKRKTSESAIPKKKIKL